MSTHYTQTTMKIKRSGMEFMFVEIYGCIQFKTRRWCQMWEDLRGLGASVQGPLLCMGDYNAILQAEDRPQGSPVQDVEVTDFNDFLKTVACMN